MFDVQSSLDHVFSVIHCFGQYNQKKNYIFVINGVVSYEDKEANSE